MYKWIIKKNNYLYMHYYIPPLKEIGTVKLGENLWILAHFSATQANIFILN